MNRTILKILVAITFLGGANLPLAYALTSPEHLAWWFYGSVGMFLGGAFLLISYIVWKIIDNFISL